MIVKINKKKYDVNGNGIYNITMYNSKNENITENLKSLSSKNKLLKNNTINIKGYKFEVINKIKKVMNNSNLEIVEK